MCQIHMFFSIVKSMDQSPSVFRTDAISKDWLHRHPALDPGGQGYRSGRV